MGQHRIVVIGNTCAGKSSLGARAAEALGVPFVDLDALYWKPGWQEPETEQFRQKVDQETAGPSWVVAGNYLRQQQDISWTRANRVVWLDIALPIILGRVVTRSFRRWKNRELLWGTNHERFFSHFKLWDRHTSLLAWAVWRHERGRGTYAAAMRDPRWRHIEFHRLGSTAEAERWLEGLLGAQGAPRVRRPRGRTGRMAQPQGPW